ncbi:tRNA (adenosine(37)-N6)-threonylcarbamoyltransferase complex ATPase subunit type 1 TsaE [Dokdonella sp.]|uniref:tRNA (adenosine(37)-N6)-threonylcarbamoyltransferase complex ATPase subunit type 1 TsaE n=1 Tax=Dokdonella sp. TaxID=2291710 RepID=UPI003C44568F
MNAEMQWKNIDEAGLVDIAKACASTIGKSGVVFLDGDLGVGKTTFARALIAALGVGERIKSPTYSLVESYQAGNLRVHHLDLYRIADAEELEWLGLPDLLQGDMLMLVEWPQRALAALPAADLKLNLLHAGDRRDLVLEAASQSGRTWMAAAALRLGRSRPDT